MGEWELTTLGGVASISSGSAPPPAAGDFDVMGANGRIGSSPVANFGPGYLVGRVGAAGAITRVVSPCWASDNTLTVVPNTAIDEVFLGHMLTALRLDDLATKTAQPLVTQSELRKRPIALPPLEEQRRVAQILNTIDETIQATERVIAKLEHVIEGVLQRASLGRPDTEYPAVAIGDFCSLSAGRTAPRGMSAYYGGEVPWVKSGEVAGLAILSTEETVTAKAVQDLGLRIVRAGTPLVAMYGATAGEVGWLGIDAATNQAVLAVEPEAERADRRWLYWALRLNSGRMLASIQGSGQPNLSKQIIGAMQMSLPDLEKQAAEVERVDSAQASVEVHRAEAMKLHRTRAGLAADLLSGRIRTVST